MNKYSPLLFVMIFSFLFGDANVQIRLQNGQKVQGEFVGTYMNHVHILVEEKIIYYACDDITSITYSTILRFDYDCSINTVTADILFPPELDPMTGEMTQMLPDVFNPDIPKPAIKIGSTLAGGDVIKITVPPFPPAPAAPPPPAPAKYYEDRKILEDEYLPSLEESRFKKEYKGKLSFEEFKTQEPEKYTQQFESYRVERSIWDMLKGDKQMYQFGFDDDAKQFSKTQLTAAGKYAKGVSDWEDLGLDPDYFGFKSKKPSMIEESNAIVGDYKNTGSWKMVEAGGVSTEPHPKVNSDLKNISISHLTKEQKKKYNQNRITISGETNYWSIYRGQEELYRSDFFIITGYPEKNEIEKHNAQLKTKNMWRGCGWYSLCALIGLAPPLGGGSATDDTIEMGIVGGLVGIAYFFYDYNVKKLEGASLNEAKIIAEKYNNDLIQRIFNEND